jgi:hypothetical protein
MAWLSIYTTLVDAVAAETTLRQRALRDADGVDGGDGGDKEGRDRSDTALREPTLGERMAEAAVARLTGRQPHRGPVVEVQLVVTDRTLFGPLGAPGREQPARIVGGGMVPAEAARELVRPRGEGGAEDRRVAIRRLAVKSGTLQLAGIDRQRRFLPARVRAGLMQHGKTASADPVLERWRSYLARPPGPDEIASLGSVVRRFTGMPRQFVLVRDPVCRAPWCSAPVRHVDHARPHCDGGQTSVDNGQGLCVGHNLAKEDPGWRVLPAVPPVADSGGHALTWRGPSGGEHTSESPPLLGWGWGIGALPRRAVVPSALEAQLEAFLRAA